MMVTSPYNVFEVGQSQYLNKSSNFQLPTPYNSRTNETLKTQNNNINLTTNGGRYILGTFVKNYESSNSINDLGNT